VPKKGVWLLTGENGSGKSAILTCLYRIAYSDAFRDHLPSSSRSKNLDNFRTATVSYHYGNEHVSYIRNEQRWSPTPKKGGNVLKKFGFSEVIFVGATAERISPKPEDFDPARSRTVDTQIAELANEIFKTSRFADLRVANVTRGVNEAFVQRKGSRTPYQYYSEKSFSVGELCVLKMLKKLLQVRNGALVLIDELEIALHPSAQFRLFKVMERIALERNHTVIFSTHSATLVKVAKTSTIFFVKPGPTQHTIIQGPKKSFVLGKIAGSEERSCDRVYIVEDNAAKAFVDEAMELIAEGKPVEQRAQFRTVRAGNYTAAIDLYKAIQLQNDSICEAKLLMDADVEEALQQKREQQPDHEHACFYFSGRSGEYLLPYTPECFVALVARQKPDNFFENISAITSYHQFSFGDLSAPETNGSDNRGACKTFYGQIKRALGDKTGLDHDSVIFRAAILTVKQLSMPEWNSIRRVIN
jgi:predicted ATPase